MTMSKIKQLDEHLTNLIAAGEVVERPSGILKELIENSIDANSSSIIIETKQGGLDYISVIDNGEGMDKVDLKLAFERHSTSKIKEVRDLSNISSLGFRGEALPSIASVSKVEAISNNQKIVLDNGKVFVYEPTSSNQGTTIIVSELFYKTPARLKYLKSPSYEAQRNLSLVQQFALGYPHISFELISDMRQVFKSNGNNDLNEVLFHVYGYEIAKLVKLFEGENYDFKVSGGYVLPHIHRANKYNIFIYLNHRMIRYYKVSSTIIELFQRYMPSDRYPIVVINIETDNQLVDVNVHPSKWEVRLSKEPVLIDLIERTLSDSLSENMSVRKSSATLFEKPMVISFDDIIREDSRHHFVNEPKEEIDTTESLIETNKEAESIQFFEALQPTFNTIEVIGQHHGNYILAQDNNHLYIFDQHASMERVQYEKILKQLETKSFSQQLLLLPYVFDNQQYIVTQFDQYKSVLDEIGLDLEVFSESSLVLRSVPTWMHEEDAQNVTQSILDYLNDDKTIKIGNLNHSKIASKACHSSVRFNERLTISQLQRIVDDVLNCQQPYHCPHGRPTFIKVDSNQLMKEFSR